MRGKKGFTLIELMVVVSIIGILSIVLIPKLGGMKDSARDMLSVTNEQSLDSFMSKKYEALYKYLESKSDLVSIYSNLLTMLKAESEFSEMKNPYNESIKGISDTIYTKTSSVYSDKQILIWKEYPTANQMANIQKGVLLIVSSGTGNFNVIVSGETNTGLSITNDEAAACGYYHSIVLERDGSILVAGSNKMGSNNTYQLGINTSNNVKKWTKLIMKDSGGNPIKFRSIAAGHYHSMAVDYDGNIWVAGDNTYGQLGTGNNNVVPIWKKVTVKESGEDVKFQSVSTGGGYTYNFGGYLSHSFAIDINGKVWATGSNNYGELGDGTTTSTNTWKNISNIVPLTSPIYGKKLKQASVGWDHSLLLDIDGFVYAVGDNTIGQFGNGKDATTSARPTNHLFSTAWEIVNNDTKIIYGRDFGSFLIKNSGNLFSTGLNDYGQLGSKASSTDFSSAQNGVYNPNNPGSWNADHINTWANHLNANIKSITSNFHSAVALDTENNSYGCGYNGNGKDYFYSNDPNGYYRLGLYNNSYPTENGKTPDSKVIEPKWRAVAIFRTGGSSDQYKGSVVAAGLRHTIFLDSKGNIYGTGNSVNGELGMGYDQINKGPNGLYGYNTWTRVLDYSNSNNYNKVEITTN